jgi:GPI mannosyltransferase 3
VFYGRNRWDYYVTEGLPLLLTTALPFALWGVYKAAAKTYGSKISTTSADRVKSLVLTVVFTIFSLSLVSHKEVRFLYPLLPALNIIAAGPATRFFSRKSTVRNALLFVLVLFNFVFAWYVTQVHQRGVIDVMHHLRTTHEARVDAAAMQDNVTTIVGFFMPCHSTPWRSHLIHADIDAWALTCEPPLNVPLHERAAYLDEADQFYADPAAWMNANLGNPKLAGDSSTVAKRWPEQVVFFEQLLPVMVEHLKGTAYKECWRGFNTHWHDDSRRKGDVIVFCID